jgi:hypothetical protein
MQFEDISSLSNQHDGREQSTCQFRQFKEMEKSQQTLRQVAWKLRGSIRELEEGCCIDVEDAIRQKLHHEDCTWNCNEGGHKQPN